MRTWKRRSSVLMPPRRCHYCSWCVQICKSGYTNCHDAEQQLVGYPAAAAAASAHSRCPGEGMPAAQRKRDLCGMIPNCCTRLVRGHRRVGHLQQGSAGPLPLPQVACSQCRELTYVPVDAASRNRAGCPRRLGPACSRLPLRARLLQL